LSEGEATILCLACLERDMDLWPTTVRLLRDRLVDGEVYSIKGEVDLVLCETLEALVARGLFRKIDAARRSDWQFAPTARGQMAGRMLLANAAANARPPA
jgi:hypothetical protein